MPDCVDAAMQSVEAAALDPVLDLVPGVPECSQLAVSDNAMLSDSRGSDRPVSDLSFRRSIRLNVKHTASGANGDDAHRT